jgi:hypothetical protein
MKTIKQLTLFIGFALILNSCGGGGGGTGGDDTPKSTTNSLSGVAVDGPIYDAKVEVFAISDSDFTNPIATTTTSSDANTIGEYSFSDINLPDEYIVRISGGRDTGPDGIINANDGDSFEMLSIAKKIDGTNTVHISPATTIQTHFVKDENLNLADAKAKIKQLFALGDSIDLATTNPKTNDIGSKAGTLIVKMAEVLPVERNLAIKAIAKELNAKSTKTFDVSSTSVKTQNISLATIANRVNDIKNGAISDDIVEKITKADATLQKLVVNTTNKIKAAEHTGSVLSVASHNSLLTVKDIIHNDNIEEINFDNLEQIAKDLEDNFATILEQNLTLLTAKNTDIIAGVVMNAASVNSTTLTTIANKTKNIDDNKKLLVQNIYNNATNNLDKVNDLNFAELDDLVVQDANENFAEDMAEIVAKTLVADIVNSNPIVISDIANKTVKNDTLKQTVKYISDNNQELQQKANLSSAEKAQLRANKIMLENVQNNLVKTGNFTQDMKNNLDFAKSQVKDRIKLIMDDDTKDLIDVLANIKAIEIASRYQDLTNFNSGNLEQDITKINNVVDNLINNTTENDDIYSSFDNIDKYFDDNIDSKNFDDITSDIGNNLDDYIDDKAEYVVLPYIPTPPALGDLVFDI